MTVFRVPLVHRLLSVLVLISFMLNSIGAVYLVAMSEPLPLHLLHKQPFGKLTLYRTYVHLRHLADQQRMAELTAQVLSMGDDWAVVLVNEEQLSDLARLGFRPSQINSLTELGFSLSNLNNHATRDALLGTPPVDSDNDGLTDTEEGYWCTDSNNPNSDGDPQSHNDGTEIEAILDFTLPRTIRWGYGPPFGPPAAWPDWNGQDGNPNTPACNDGDYDTIPDFAESYVVGSNPLNETTDYDKFDDGQELFGVTYCPGGTTSCGHGNYPRIEYWNYIKATMPNWVRPPGDNIFVSAFPVPEVSVVPGSWTVERVTTITTEEGQMTQTTHSYETSVTQGQSTSIANTVTWNEWEEVSQAVETPINSRQAFLQGNWDWNKIIGGGVTYVFGEALTCISGSTVEATLSFGLALGGCFVGDTISNIGWDIMTSGFNGSTSSDGVQPSYLYSFQNVDGIISTGENATNVINNIDMQGVANSLDGIQYAINQQGQLLARGLHDISYAISQPRFTETHTNGRSWGGAQTTTHEVYEEHTITEGEAFTNGQNWSTAWAVDSSHAADLTFTYHVDNTGTEYAREITGLIFNVYLGEDPNPIISYPAWQQFPNGKLENVFPGDPPHTYTTNPIPLTLEQMKRIDLGEHLTIIMEDFSYGADELFYQDAVEGGITFFIEDGVADEDELVDSYVIPTWMPESVQDVLTRFFPADVDNEGNLNSLETPEFNGTNPPTWNEHFLSEIAWWNIYLTQADAGNTPLHELNAEAGSALLFRFNRDSDRDGYQDRVEWKYYCSLPPENPDSQYCETAQERPEIHPQPAVTAGYVTSREGDEVTVLLKIANSGTFDAYGIDTVMYAPDDTVTIGNNTVGGNGRVRPGTQVAVGSLILPPDLTDWTNSTAKMYAAGNYSGDIDKVITFTVDVPGVVGQGSTALDWASTGGGNGTLDLGSNYHAPLPVDIIDGVQVGFDTGTMLLGESFTVSALTPRDTFTYTIESEPYTPPVIVVSYSDPQGSHRFITPVELSSLGDDLTPYGDQMIPDIQLATVTTEPFDPITTNTTHFILNSPHPEPIEGAHLYLNFVSDGELVAELPYTMTLQPGPTVYPVSWSTGIFSDTYNPDGDNILIAFWTDAQDNIIDSAARPLTTFQEDALAKAATTATTWNFGTITQGTLLQKEISLANVGFVPLHVSTVGSEALIATPASVGPAQFQTLELALDTALLPTGPYNGTLIVRTSDINNPTLTINVSGTIAPLTTEALAHGVDNTHPWNQYAYVPGPHNLNDVVTFNHTIPDVQDQTHPLYVYTQDGNNLLGVGEYGPDFTGVGVSSSIFGDGSDGNIVISSTTTFASPASALASTAVAGQSIVNFAAGYAFETGDEILLIQVQGVGAGQYEFAQVVSRSGNEITLAEPLQNTYTQEGVSKAYATKVHHFRNVTVTSTGQWLAPAWNGSEGGILVFRATGAVTVESGGSIDASGNGFRGGSNAGDYSYSQQGESYTGVGGYSRDPNGGGGGGGGSPGGGGAGGGGGYGSTGENGDNCGNCGLGGNVYGIEDLSLIHLGSGGGGLSSPSSPSQGGGNGGGAILLMARQINIFGIVTARGGDGGNQSGAGYGAGGGSGGTILLVTQSGDSVPNLITAVGGLGGQNIQFPGGDGGVGRIRIEYCNSFTGTTDPPASTQQLNCYIIRQLPGSPNTELTLPEVISDTQYVRYHIPYGQRGNFTAAGTQAYTLTLPKRAYATFTLNALFENLGASNFNFTVDVGANGSIEWSGNGTEQPAILNSPQLVAGLNTYLVSTPQDWGEAVVVPINVTLNTSGDVFLTNLVAVPGGDSDPQVSAGDLTISNSIPHAGELVNLTATVHNPGNYTASNVVVSFFAGDPAEDGVYLGSDFIPTLAVGGTATTDIVWDTSGYASAVDVYVVLDVAGQIPELDEENNQTSVTIEVIANQIFLPIIARP